MRPRRLHFTRGQGAVAEGSNSHGLPTAKAYRRGVPESASAFQSQFRGDGCDTDAIAGDDEEELDPARGAAVVAAFSSFFFGFESFLGDRLIGAWDRLNQISPQLASAVDAAEGRADRLAVEHMHGRAPWRDFELALGGYELAWKDATAVLRAAETDTDVRRCTDCGREGMVVLVFDDRGHPFCRTCLTGRK